jgi:hypothetical protein
MYRDFMIHLQEAVARNTFISLLKLEWRPSLTSGMEALIDLRTATVAQSDAAEQTCLDLDQDTALAAGPGVPKAVKSVTNNPRGELAANNKL